MKNNRSTTTLLQGRLGNQLFEYAFARACSLESGAECILSEAPLVANKIQNRLDCFILSPDIKFKKRHHLSLCQRIGMSIYAHFVASHPRMKRHELEKKYRWIWNLCGLFLCEDGYVIPPSKEQFSNKDYVCVGYMQSEKYFYKYRQKILQELIFKTDIQESVHTIAKEIRTSTEPTCLHVRLGDYVKNPLHGVADATYYRRALAELRKHKPDATIFVFSDNIPLVREELNLGSDIRYIPSYIDEQQTMFLGSLCKNFLISNSSFSWWMQYLSNAESKLVIAPSKWYAKECPCDIQQRNWLLLDI